MYMNSDYYTMLSLHFTEASSCCRGISATPG